MPSRCYPAMGSPDFRVPSKEPGKSDENNAPRKEGGRKRDIEGAKEGRRKDAWFPDGKI